MLNGYKFSTGNFPATADGLRALLVRPDHNRRWAGPYIESALDLAELAEFADKRI